MKKFFYCIFGILFMSIGITFYILYFNLFVFGYSFFEYLLFLFSRWECYLFFAGLFFVCFGIIRKGKRNDIYL